MENISSQAVIPDSLPEEVKALLASWGTSVDYLSFDEDGNILLPLKVRIDLDDGHDYGRCILARNPKAQWDERVGDWTFEVMVPKAHQRRIDTGEVRRQFDTATATVVETPVFKNESRVMVVATQVEPITEDKVAFPIDEVRQTLAVRKSSDRRTGKLKPEGKGRRVVLSEDLITTAFYTGLPDTGEVYRMGNPNPEIVVPEGPNRTEVMQAFVDAFDGDAAPDAESIEAFKAEYNLE